MSNHHRPSVEEAFNPELRQAEADWNKYLDTQPFRDERNRLRAPNGQFVKRETLDRLADNARIAYYHESMDMPLEERSFFELVDKLSQAEQDGDKTKARNITDVLEGMDKPWEELSFGELSEKVAQAELDGDKTIAGYVTDVLIEKMIDFAEKTNLDSDAQTNLNNRILTSIENKKTKILEKDNQNDSLELPAEGSHTASSDSLDVSLTEGTGSKNADSISASPERVSGESQDESLTEGTINEAQDDSNIEANLQVTQARLNRVIDEIADFGEADDNQLRTIEQLVDKVAALSGMDEAEKEQLLDEQLSKAGVSQERFNEFVVSSDSANEEGEQANGRLKTAVHRTGEKLRNVAGRSNLLLGRMFYKVGDTLSRKQAELSDNEKLKRGRRIVLATGAVALGGALYYAHQKGWLDGVTDALPFGAGDTGAEGIAEQVDLGEGLPSEVGPAEESGIDFTGDIPDEIAEGQGSVDLGETIPDEIAGGEAPDADSGESQTGDDNTDASEASEGNSSAGTDGEQAQQIDITNEMRNVRPGQGWYETFQNLNISPSGWSELLDVVGPELESMNLAYPDGSGSYGINSTADLPDDALQLILSKARELGIN